MKACWACNRMGALEGQAANAWALLLGPAKRGDELTVDDREKLREILSAMAETMGEVVDALAREAKANLAACDAALVKLGNRRQA